eukprot:208435-Amphidinium_carterae.1
MPTHTRTRAHARAGTQGHAGHAYARTALTRSQICYKQVEPLNSECDLTLAMSGSGWSWMSSGWNQPSWPSGWRSQQDSETPSPRDKFALITSPVFLTPPLFDGWSRSRRGQLPTDTVRASDQICQDIAFF